MSSIQSVSEAQIIEFDLGFKGQKLHFKMKESLGLDDEAWVAQHTDFQSGKLNSSGLWAKRLSTSIIQPKMTTSDIQGLPKALLDALKVKWTILNSIDQVAFLESPEAKTGPAPEAE